MATYRNSGILDYQIPGDGTRPVVTVEPGDTLDADTNPNSLYFEWVEGEPPDGAGDFNSPDEIPVPAEPEVDPESTPDPEPDPAPDPDPAPAPADSPPDPAA